MNEYFLTYAQYSVFSKQIIVKVVPKQLIQPDIVETVNDVGVYTKVSRRPARVEVYLRGHDQCSGAVEIALSIAWTHFSQGVISYFTKYTNQEAQ